jgi:hypothetical protein
MNGRQGISYAPYPTSGIASVLYLPPFSDLYFLQDFEDFFFKLFVTCISFNFKIFVVFVALSKAFEFFFNLSFNF